MAEILKRFVRDMMEIQDEALIISLSILILVAVVLIIYWFYNRRKFQELRHEIPAHVVKNYLDSIIQNSNSLKSSLFRGGGLDISEGIPSVVPLSDLPSSSIHVGGASTEELNQKNARIARLTDDLTAKDRMILDLERRLGDLASAGGSGEEVKIMQDEISKLRSMLDQKENELEDARSNASSSGDSSEFTSQIADLSNERDRLKEQLQEYSIIEDDLANVKKLQQENEQLKKALDELKAGGSAPAVAVAEPVSEPEVEAEPEPEMEAAPESVADEAIPDEVADSDIDLEAEMAKAISDSQAAPAAEPEESFEEEAVSASSNDEEPEVPSMEDGDKKSAEELLSEFEKMLG
ncbi:hypothetical protein M899_2939 [Bacteriovorax sp. BSW11_IV]|uniref:phage tail tape measure protein n=1 Tax=Bacteriovorax sp. BSW11_IV TaxID=1353529 RepID=UPI00038A32F8|nr:phage tail tape measure protein [Bacteriovorax sp. BSW11_IV]EQC50124.1 hypothetical protein M899_2939 [Bacteriovorax sp. BSW11_IV]